MQPYFFPYLGYFQLIHSADEWLFFDTPQYIRHGWVNRNRILKYDGSDTVYITVPLEKHSREASINSVLAVAGDEWKDKIRAQLLPYKKKAPFYKETMSVVEEVLSRDLRRMSEIAAYSVHKVCEYAGMQCPMRFYSEQKFEHAAPAHAGEWALYISDAMQADEYINPPGGRDIFQKEQFEQKNIKLRFLEPGLHPYEQRNRSFIPGLSIIDVMMFNSQEQLRNAMSSYQICE